MPIRKFQKMWESANTYVFDIDTGSILPIIKALPQTASFADKQWLYFYQGGIGGAYYEEGEMEKAKAAGLRDFLDENYQRQYFAGIDDCLIRQKILFERIQTSDIESLSNPALKTLLKESVDLIVQNFGYYLACQPQCILGLEELAQAKLQQYCPTEEVRNVFTLLSTPTEVTRLRQEEIDWLTILIEAKKKGAPISDEPFKSQMVAHYQKYRLLGSADGQPPADSKDYFDKFEEQIKQDLSKLEAELSKISDSLTEIAKSKAEAIAAHQIPEEVVKITNLLSQIGHVRLMMRIDSWMPAYHHNLSLINEISKRFSLPEALVRFASVEELYNLLSGLELNHDLLKERSEAFLFVIEDGKTRLLGGEQAVQEFNQLVPKADLSGITEIKGNIAMRGRAVGKVVLFKWGDDLAKKVEQLSEGSILVAGQTRPQLMPLISKSSAIVTDEGGITSHAAIVSRELGIPCIIGTKIATQVIKDGDMVEVDADNGVVKIL